MPNIIVLKGLRGLEIEQSTAAEEITPGMLLKITPDGEVEPHDEAGGIAERIFALEASLLGNEISDVYAAGEKVAHAVCNRGNYVYGLLAPGESVQIGDFLQPGGDGTLMIITDPTSEGISAGTFIGSVLEEVNNASGVTAVRVKIRIA